LVAHESALALEFGETLGIHRATLVLCEGWWQTTKKAPEKSDALKMTDETGLSS
jgi:hypothetical protein